MVGFCVAKSKNYTLLMDTGSVGPAYQPGHAHANTLSLNYLLGT